ncbi:hypothetical protein [Agromyces larvae]|uniref:Uncharacterized protein n=1 Tax=Agromyces larvae TaxID=2929802 RepID=A0ABY4BXL7_9MICO|nr:hypothetical protein [Agromyces larvae]UOE43499.1 hypothetical protein MTO99_15155 [Agromyces larvae]
MNGSAPDDFASIRLANNSSGCLSLGATYVHTYTYDGAATGKGYLYDAGAGTNSPIAGVRDGVSGFKMDADHGVVLSHLRSHYCGPVDLSGMFTYEHNQDGGAVASVSASFFGFGVSYSAPSSTLQKSSGIVQF